MRTKASPEPGTGTGIVSSRIVLGAITRATRM
jgi:hypothetical protein